MDDEQLGFY